MKKFCKFNFTKYFQNETKICEIPQYNVDSSHKTFSFQYEFNWEVKDREAKADGAFFTHNEKKEEANPDRTEGEYRVWLPDGR